MTSSFKVNVLRLIVPIYNEENFLSLHPQVVNHFKELSSLEGVEVLFAIGGGDDGSFDFILKATRNSGFIRVIKEDIRHPSVHKSVLIGASYDFLSYRYALICPVDVTLKREDLKELTSYLACEAPHYGVFKKCYQGSSLLLKLQAHYLNLWRLGVFKEFVWTNGLFIKKELLVELLGDKHMPSFLDDLYLCSLLQRRGLRPVIFPRKLVVSIRRYQQRGELKQILTNLVVLMGHGIGLKKRALKKLYRHT